MAVGLRVSSTQDKPTRFYSKKQEDAVAKSLDGHRNANSGATDFVKGDVSTSDFLIECKTKTSHSESISVKKEWITKNAQEALFMGKPYCAVAFSFGPDEPNYFIIDNTLMQYLLEKLREEKI